jgi:hypothetical protein
MDARAHQKKAGTLGRVHAFIFPRPRFLSSAARMLSDCAPGRPFCYNAEVIPLHRARNVFLALLFLIPFTRAHALIGDDLGQLRAAYGSASAVGGQMIFKHDGYSIAVYFDGTRSGMEIFVRDGSIPGKTDITQADIDAILVLEGQGQSWNPVQVHSGQPTWLRADRKIIARFNPTEKILAIIVNAK